ncbi:MAG: response regulator [Fimbriimonas sp.]|nr:response regulator [Fimbriimonas sp.]
MQEKYDTSGGSSSEYGGRRGKKGHVDDPERLLVSLIDAVQDILDLDGLLVAIADMFTDTWGFDQATVYWYDPAGKGMHAAGRLESMLKGAGSEPSLANRLSDCTGWQDAEASEVGYILGLRDHSRSHATVQTSKLPNHAVFRLRMGDDLVGCVAVDFASTHRSISSDLIAEVLPFAKRVALAVHVARLRAERASAVRLQRQLTDIAIAIVENEDSDLVLRRVRDALLETGLVDRVGVWLVENFTAIGTWGTDEAGKPIDEHGLSYPLDVFAQEHRAFWSGSEPYVIFPHHVVHLSDGTKKTDVSYGVMALKAGEELVGLVTVDMALSGRSLSPEVFDLLLPIAKQAGVVVHNSRLRAGREAVIREQQKLMEIAVAITANEDTDAVLRMVRDAIIEIGSIDRVGVWLIDDDVARGTWGTDDKGRLADEHQSHFELDGFRDYFAECMKRGKPYAISIPERIPLNDGTFAYNVPCAVVPLRTGENVVGLVTVDTLLTRRPIRPEQLEVLLPLTKQAAIVVQNHRLLLAANQEIERRKAAEDLLTKQAEELTIARDEALAGTQAKSEFLANMSHEIRTPMNGVTGMISMLLQTALTSEQRDYARSVQKSAEALLSVINDILVFSKLEAGMTRIEAHPFSLRTCVQDVAEMLAAQVKRDSVELNCFVPTDFPDDLIGDTDRLRQVITNLVGNAVKFTSKGEVFVKATCVSETRSSATVRIDVIDTGIGIAENRMETIFDPFTQVDGSLTRRRGGTGLGLTITKRIVDLMGGSIGLETRLGSGSAFWVQLEFPKNVESPSSLAETGPIVGKTVLVVSSSAYVSFILGEYVRGLGGSVHPVHALAELSEIDLTTNGALQFDIVLIDQRLPQMDGIEALHVLRGTLAAANAKFIVIASLQDRMQESASRFGAFDGVVNKPIRLTHLRSILSRAVRSEPVDGPSTPQTSSDKPLAGLRLLLAEDNLVNATVATGRLGMWGCRCDLAENGVEAVQAAQSGHYDAILMDVSMPEMDGIQATTEIRKREGDLGVHVPIIAMTAYALEGDREKCLAAGMDDYVSKPVDFDELLRKLHFWVKGSPDVSAAPHP